MPQVWTRGQRPIVLCFVVLLLGALGLGRWWYPVELSDPPPEHARRGDELLGQLDPNTADASALAAIPNLGEKHAAALVAYREKFRRLHPGQLAFKRPEDLLPLSGFGVSTMTNITPYLSFPNSATRPAKR